MWKFHNKRNITKTEQKLSKLNFPFNKLADCGTTETVKFNQCVFRYSQKQKLKQFYWIDRREYLSIFPWWFNCSVKIWKEIVNVCSFPLNKCAIFNSFNECIVSSNWINLIFFCFSFDSHKKKIEILLKREPINLNIELSKA